MNVESLQAHQVVADMIPNPLRTHLTNAAESSGCRVVDGFGMLVNQRVISVNYWKGVEVDPAVMRDRVREVLEM